ncbi:MAG: metalloregulator ArsR/SmtB family transcription factor [bacterium]|nr:metalloregulator ArsR/SmtB family transcription factor [bacterium]
MADPFDLKLRALADPRRRRILELLAVRDRGVADLAEECGLSAPTVSHHLAILREAGLAGMRKEGRHHDFYLVPTGPGELVQWLNLLRQRRSQPAWNQEAYREAALRSFLEHSQRGLPSHPRRRQVVLDWFHSLLERDRLLPVEEVAALWSPHYADWEEILAALVELGRVERRGDYILISD